MTTVTDIHPTHAWQRSMRDGIATVQELLEFVQVDENRIDAMQPTRGEFPLRVPRSYAARMRKGDPADPLLLQVLPLHAERMDVSGFEPDPLRETGLASHGVLKKYRGRALLVTTPACPVHCRYCFRRHFPYEEQVAAKDRWEPALRALRGMTDVTEVILSGGDPLSLTNRRLGELLRLIEALGHIDTVRFHTRFPIVLPERVDRSLLKLLADTPLHTVMVVHCNHANEIDRSVHASLEAVAETGTLLLNQSVLIKSVNDNADRLESLSRALFRCGVLPYYLHLLDPVSGGAHFDVPASRGTVLIEELRRRLPGYLVPRLVREEPGQPGKTAIG
ncbi:MAG: EF-P beta-lysylation protein EpmB [Rhodospirillaceae bacterium]|nr:EF-P beta-lysylation protein EpmB [Rhodospirillaceae bacterium]MDD9999975.1 EF-P beta-lysylation protein EpmB [Rhodospirillaceae bacterium]MDE0360158.1 EF-P beta-lysylation protein EpmB [Rhodospirillaceae bacterium]